MELQPIYEKLQIQEMNQMQKSTFQASENEQDIILLSQQVRKNARVFVSCS